MTFYHVAVHHKAHTCPADPDLHAWDTARTVIGIVDGGPCQTPKTITSCGTNTVIACARFHPAEGQCRACRTTITETQVTTTETEPIR